MLMKLIPAPKSGGHYDVNILCNPEGGYWIKRCGTSEMAFDINVISS
jgi:hypothetical protein